MNYEILHQYSEPFEELDPREPETIIKKQTVRISPNTPNSPANVQQFLQNQVTTDGLLPLNQQGQIEWSLVQPGAGGDYARNRQQQ
jgi:hypothetical protein